MNKKLDTAAIQNELSGQSVFFQQSKNMKSKVETNRTENRSEIRSNERPEQRSEIRSVDLPVKRQTKRYSFEFYEDQIHQIKKIKINAELQGKSIALSEIVRKAIDDYLLIHFNEKEME